MRFVVKAKDGNVFISYKHNKQWVATRSGGKYQYFTKGYITEWTEL